MPRFSHDDVVDFMVVEAGAFKMNRLREEERKKQESAQRRGSHKKLRGLKPGDPVPEGMG